MNIKDQIKTLIGIDITTDNFEALFNYPEDYAKSNEDLAKLKELISLIEMAMNPEVSHYDYK